MTGHAQALSTVGPIRRGRSHAVAPGGWVQTSGGVLAKLDLDLVEGRGWASGVPTGIPSLFTCTRAAPAAAYYLSADGTLRTFAANTLRYGSNGLLVEEQRINLALQSQTFDNASWTKTRSSVTADQATAPDGTTTADFLKEDNTVTNTHLITQAITITTVVYGWSIYVKPNGRTWIGIDANDGSAHVTYFQLTGNGTVGTNAAGNTASIQALANGWYRCMVSRTAAATTGVFTLYLATADNTNTYSGDNASGVYLWGAQLELSAAAYPVSTYIPTTSASVTRNVDAVVSANVNWLTQGIGTFVVSVLPGSINNEPGIFSLNSGSGADRVDMRADNPIASLLNTATVNIASLNPAGAIAVGTAFKSAVAYNTNDMAAVTGGGAAATDATGTPLANATQLQLGALDGGTSNVLNGYLRRLTYWNVRLSNSVMQALTT